jgi:hypothetical protein
MGTGGREAGKGEEKALLDKRWLDDCGNFCGKTGCSVTQRNYGNTRDNFLLPCDFIKCPY